MTEISQTDKGDVSETGTNKGEALEQDRDGRYMQFGMAQILSVRGNSD